MKNKTSNSTANKGTALEELVTLIERELHALPSVRVLHNVQMTTSFGSKRQIDILIEDNRDRFTFKTVIECKNTTARVSANTVGAFKDLVNSVGAHQGIIVSTAGFQKGARESATAGENIFLYHLSQVHELKDYLCKYCFNKYQLKHVSKEITVRFSEPRSINAEVKLHTGLFSSRINKKVTLADIAQDFLKINHTQIIKTLLPLMADPLKDSQINCEIGFEINFPSLIFESKNAKTEITGLKAIVNTELSSNRATIINISDYKDISKEKTHALIFNIEYNGELFQCIDKV